MAAAIYLPCLEGLRAVVDDRSGGCSLKGGYVDPAARPSPEISAQSARHAPEPEIRALQITGQFAGVDAQARCQSSRPHGWRRKDMT